MILPALLMSRCCRKFTSNIPIINATDEPYNHYEYAQVSITYRQNVWKEWLFYELIPRYQWEREPYEKHTEEANITLRLEVLFNNV